MIPHHDSQPIFHLFFLINLNSCRQYVNNHFTCNHIFECRGDLMRNPAANNPLRNSMPTQRWLFLRLEALADTFHVECLHRMSFSLVLWAMSRILHPWRCELIKSLPSGVFSANRLKRRKAPIKVCYSIFISIVASTMKIHNIVILMIFSIFLISHIPFTFNHFYVFLV